ncbi:hypothetical protein ACGLWX_18280 [Halomonas sp. HMF6819]|uniref:hypothetical protein n=1 Tax=Halomonas sp. HMF6819 TaxID=3373085 RepID=UPI0037BD0112
MTTKGEQLQGRAVTLVGTVSIWLHPVAQGGLGNIASFVAWPYVLMLLLGALLCHSYGFDGVNRLWPRPIGALFLIARWGGIFWLIYHGALAMPILLVAAGFIFWSAKKTHTTQRGEA